MKVGMNFKRDLPYLDVVISYYFKNRQIKCSNCEECINGRCCNKDKSLNEIRECMIKKSMNHVQESKRRGMAVYTDPNRY
ncbi:hypothetical protein SAMN02745134_02895 [Clostridium acidisoli DSM 12555]|jgi:hypothetical protein|uniref:Uncharacterized protein n=1 Tax=Clostridium acidisoli DSM 12555 TaxID=1121291 RepID=A0A1W1XRT8_9CLOT|nr:hypothetical protein [Clostridium acidisoli]SMC26607.1 hypothetical protein SAMN02745134_02895 [Clostridium acidisoli DSM 12555]